MRLSLYFMVLFLVFRASVVCAQEPTDMQSGGTEMLSTGAVAQRARPGNNQSPEEKHPRLFWIFPTYTVQDVKSVSRLTVRGKWRLFVKDETDPFTFGWAALWAGVAQVNNDLAGYGPGAAGYGKRFGALVADETAAGFFGTFLFPSVLHQDPRYYRLGAGPFKKRFGHALIRPILTHKDSGGRAFNWSGMLGGIATSGLANSYYPGNCRGAGATFSRAAMALPLGVMDELFNEFGPDLEKKIFRKKSK